LLKYSTKAVIIYQNSHWKYIYQGHLFVIKAGQQASLYGTNAVLTDRQGTDKKQINHATS